MTSSRQQLVHDLELKLRAKRLSKRPYKVGGAELVDLPATGRTVAVWATQWTPTDRFGFATVQIDFDVWVFVGLDNPKAADDDLDTALFDVLGVITELPYVTWSQATRQTIANNNAPGYLIKVTAVARNDTEA